MAATLEISELKIADKLFKRKDGLPLLSLETMIYSFMVHCSFGKCDFGLKRKNPNSRITFPGSIDPRWHEFLYNLQREVESRPDTCLWQNGVLDLIGDSINVDGFIRFHHHESKIQSLAKLCWIDGRNGRLLPNIWSNDHLFINLTDNYPGLTSMMYDAARDIEGFLEDIVPQEEITP